MFVCKENPENKKFIRLVYLLCSNNNDDEYFDNGKFEAPETESNSIESACKRISIAARMAQYFFQKTTNKTFRLEYGKNDNNNDKPIVYKFLIKNYNYQQLWNMKQLDLWKLIANQLMNSPLSINNNDNCKFIAFCSFSRYKKEKIIDNNKKYYYWLPEKQVNGYISLGGNYLILLSTHCLYCWPENFNEILSRFNDQRFIDTNKFMNDSYYRNTRSGCLSTTFGAMIHELGHLFNLVHCCNGIMSQEFNFIDQFFLFKRYDNWWNHNELLILNLNHWFNFNNNDNNDDDDDDDDCFIVIDDDNIIKSIKYPIRLIQYRHKQTDLIIKTKIFNSNQNIFQYTNEDDVDKNLTKLFILDNNGNSKLIYF